MNRFLAVDLKMFRKWTAYSSINLVGLALGFACALCVYALVTHESQYDAHHTQAERTYRIGALWPEWSEDGPSYQSQTPTGLIPILRAGVPGVERVAELTVSYSTQSVFAEGRFLSQERVAFVGPDFFDVFDYALVAGGLDRLAEPETVVLTETTARRYFGATSGIGKTIRYGDTREFEVVGVVGDPPAATHLPFEFFGSHATLGRAYDEWGFSDGFSAYLVLANGASPVEVEARLNALRSAHVAEEQQADQQFLLQPLSDIHTEPRYGAYPGSTVVDPVALWWLGAIGLLILLSAIVNYVNLATAQGLERAKEIGVRKAIGGTRGQIGWQLLGETGVLTVGAVALGWLAAFVALPVVGRVFVTEISRSVLLDSEAVVFTLCIAIGVSVLAGAYPAAVLSRFDPARTLRGAHGRRIGALGLRRGLIVFQFVATLSLLIGSLVVLQQVDYVQGKDLGFEADARLLVRVPDGDEARVRLRNDVLQTPADRHVTYSMGGPSKGGRLSQRYTWDGAAGDEPQSTRTIPIDAGYIDTFGLRIIAGRALHADDEVQPHSRVVLVNRSMAEEMGFADPDAAVGAMLRGMGDEDALGALEIVGVVEDFHHGSLHNNIDPSVLIFWPRWTSRAGIALVSDQGTKGLDAIEAAFASTFPETHFRYEYLDEYLGELYEGERRIAHAFRVFTALSILIAALGLFGLAALSAVQRRHEIGVRKVLGASVASLIAMLSREVVLLVAVALIIAAPIAYTLMRRWLDGFVYQIDLGPELFLVAGLAVLGIALLTVSTHALRAATMDPVRALRSQ